jgi:hypothetical protein
LNGPDFRTISGFRKRHLAALSGLFVQVLRLCQAAGLVKFGHVAVDGSKLRANASRHKAMSYKHMVQQELKLAAEVQAWLDPAAAIDAAEDAAHGDDRRGDEMPAWMADKQRRLERIRATKAQLEAEAKTELGRKPREVSGDTGFATEANLAAMNERRVRPYLSPGQQMAGVLAAPGIRQRLPGEIGQRKGIVELAIGQQTGVGGDAAAVEL